MKLLKVHLLTRPDRLIILALVLWACILFLLGGQFRYRKSAEIPTIDWVIITQLLVAGASGVVGVLLVKKNRPLGFGGRMFLLVAFFMGLSIFASAYGKLVFGYWVLFAGTLILTIGLVQSSQTAGDLIRLEKVWFCTALVTLLFNFFGVLFFSEASLRSVNILRFGQTWGHPSNLAYFASFAFCLSYMGSDMRSISFQRIARWLLFLLVLSTRTRIPLMICVFAACVQFCFNRKAFSHIWVLMVALSGAGLSFLLLGYSLDLPIGTGLFDFLARGDYESLFSLTGRTEIWKEAFAALSSSPQNLFSGFGYGVSRFTLNAEEGAHFFYAHTHNELIEIVFGMGIFCLFPYMLLLMYSLNWTVNYKKLCPRFSQTFVVRAITVMVAYYAALWFGVPLSHKIAPYTMIIIFYLVALDKKLATQFEVVDVKDVKDAKEVFPEKQY